MDVDRRLASKLPSGEAKIRGCEDQAGPNQELEARGTEWGEPWECGASRWGRSLWRRAPHREEAKRGVGAARGRDTSVLSPRHCLACFRSSVNALTPGELSQLPQG